MSVRLKNARVSKKMPLNITVYRGMRERVGVHAKNACVGVCVSALLSAHE